MQILNAIDVAQLKKLCDAKEFFWLDLINPSPTDINKLGDAMDFHQLAIEDTLSFDQRPKLDVYGNQALLILQGGVELAPEENNQHPLEEIHCYVSGDWIITIHKNTYNDLEDAKKILSTTGANKSDQYYLYKVVDAIIDSYFPILADLDDTINDLEDRIVDNAKPTDLQEIFKLKRLLLKLRKAVVPMRDVFARQIEVLADLAGLDKDSHDYFRDIYDHLIRITDMLDGYHEMVSGCTDLYLSVRADRQGEIGKQLTIIASIFLPLGFLSGIGGMNFDVMAGTILSGWWSFGIFSGIMVVSAIGMWFVFKKKGWIGKQK